MKKRDENGNWIPDMEKFEASSKFRKWRMSYWWMVFRNGAWNYIVSRIPEPIVGDDYICIIKEGDASCTTWRNKTIHGKQFCRWPKEDPKFFRYSVTKRASWYNLHRLFASIFSLKWFTHFSFMIGHAEYRHLVKMRTFNVEDN